MKRDDFDPVTIEGHWTALQLSVGGLAPIRTARQYARTVRLMNRLLDIVGENETAASVCRRRPSCADPEAV